MRKYEEQRDSICNILIVILFKSILKREKKKIKNKQVDDPHSLLRILFISQYSPFRNPSTTWVVYNMGCLQHETS